MQRLLAQAEEEISDADATPEPPAAKPPTTSLAPALEALEEKPALEATPEPPVPPPPPAPPAAATPKPPTPPVPQLKKDESEPAPPPTGKIPQVPKPPVAPVVPGESSENDSEMEIPSVPSAPKAEVEVSAPASKAEDVPAELNLNSCDVEQLVKLIGCPRILAQHIVKFREENGDFRALEDLLNIPGMTPLTYAMLTGQEIDSVPELETINDLLGFEPEDEVTLKDITERISHWPDVNGCILGQASGLPLVGSVPKFVDMSSVMAFCPRLFKAVNENFGEFSGEETDELALPTDRTSYYILKKSDLFMVILSKKRQLPERFLQVARLVLSKVDASTVKPS